MASLVLTGDVSGLVTLSAPSVAGTTTLTLPATTGTVLNDATVGVCRAWVNFNGTGTVAIRASFNVTSITDGGVGVYTVNLTTALTDVNAAPVASGQRYASTVSRAGKIDANMASTTTVRLFTGYEDSFSGAIATDLEFNHIAIFR